MKRIVIIMANVFLFFTIFQSEAIVQWAEKTLEAKYWRRSSKVTKTLYVPVVEPAPVVKVPVPLPVVKPPVPAVVPVVANQTKGPSLAGRLLSLVNSLAQRALTVPTVNSPNNAVGNRAMPPLPRFVQTLTDEQFTAWAAWQNIQVKANQGEGGNRYLYGSRTVTSYADSARATGYMQSEVDRGQFLYGGRFDSRGNDVTSSGSVRMDSRGQSVSSNYMLRYPDNDYAGPGEEMVYNPFVRSTGGVGLPDWDNLYVPCQSGSMTVSEALRKYGPIDPESLYEKLMAPYFRK